MFLRNLLYHEKRLFLISGGGGALLSMKTKKVLAVFTSVATTAAFTYYLAENLDRSEEQQIEGPQTLIDDEGDEYTLTQNEDGSETATYADGRTVTIKREENGTLRYLHGTEGLIAGLAAGYYMFHGLSGGAGGYYNAALGRYIPNGPVQPIRDRQYSSTAGSAYRSSSRGSSINTSRSSSKSSSTAKSSSHSSSKSGFGSAGARSSAS